MPWALPPVAAIRAPAPLRGVPAWLCWKYETYDGDTKPRKVPYYANGSKRRGQQGSTADRQQLATFEAARNAAQLKGMDGVGFAPLDGFGVVGLDFDNCFNPDGSLPEEVRKIAFRSYAERSPSGNGVRVFLRGDMGNSKSHGEPFGFEAFSTKGFITVTGAILDECELLGHEDTVAEPDEFTRQFALARLGPTRIPTDPDNFMLGRKHPVGLSLDEIQDLVRRLDPDMSRNDGWLEVGMALHHETEGSDEGFEIWDEWSAGGSSYKGTEDLRKDWTSFDRRAGDRREQITMRSVIKRVNQLTPEALLNRVQLPVGKPGKTLTTPADFNGKFHLRSVYDLISQPPPPWFIKGVLPKAQLGMMYGDSTSGKTFAALDMAAAIATGTDWHGHKVKQDKVIYVVAEGSGGFGKRLKAYCIAKGISAEELGVNLGLLTAAPNLTDSDEVYELIKTINAVGGAGLIILDTYAQVTAGADENSGEQMSTALKNAQLIQRQTGANVLLIHHPGKDASRGARGWSGTRAACDYELRVTQDDTGLRMLKTTKLKDGDAVLNFYFKLDVVHIGTDEDGDAITSCVIAPAEAPVGKSIIEKPSGRDEYQTHVVEVLETLPVTMDSIQLEELVRLCAEAMPTPEGDERDVRRAVITRAIRALAKDPRGPIGITGTLVYFFF